MLTLLLLSEFFRLPERVCERRWHDMQCRPYRFPWDRSILGGFQFYCGRCGKHLGYVQ